MTNTVNPNDEHLPDDMLSRLFEEDPLDIDAYVLVSEGSHPLPQAVIDGAARVARMADAANAPCALDTIVAVMLSIPNARHFEDADSFAWLAERQKFDLTDICLFATCFHCTPTQAIKTRLVERAFAEKGATVDPRDVLSIIRTLDEYASDKALWQAWLTMCIAADDVRVALSRYKLGGYEMAARAFVVARAFIFENIALPTHIALAQIARPHDFGA